MYFGELPVAEAEGAILAHSRRLDSRALKKGRVLDADDLAALKAAGIERVVCARLDKGDIPEDKAANLLASACCGTQVRVGSAFTGRANLFAEADGIVLYDPERLDGFNLVDETITLGLVPPYQAVTQGQMIGTLKIIPFAVPESPVRIAEALAGQSSPLLRVAPFQPRDTIMIQSRLPGTKESVLDSTLRVTTDRLTALGSELVSESRCDHDQISLANALHRAVAANPGLILISGASAVVDRRDVIPSAIENVGGEILHFGMPVDPGNLMLIGRIGKIPVIGMPGCARSPKLNGFDWALQRLCAGLDITPRDIMRMGAGGLLKDVPHRPLPRASAKRANPKVPQPTQKRPEIASILLAAGQSSRMGATNKLLGTLDGKPLVRWVAEAILASAAGRLVVVTGHEAEKVTAALSDLDAEFVHNPHYATGMSTSVRAGFASLPEGTDAALVCLGDMPTITARMLDALIAAYDPVEGRAIVVPVHGGKRGNPILWDHRFFEEMQELEGDKGARGLLAEFADLVAEVDVPDNAIHLDIDTPEMLADAGGTLEKAE
ncbi:NTP transferase domain-containing protein [Nisaea nitritireducens]|uniref:NTP transferase domain-containing protein n=1 Tax=Nisaea nitritireducens TaxID=568392 RepID=UPI00186720D5|nr:molybdopterin-binding/glycosyltransferase family 2 protein [Nisaea nitritireducens]